MAVFDPPGAAAGAKQRVSRRAWAVLTLVILLSTVLQTLAATQKSFWEDETYTALIAARSSSERDAAISADVHPPLYLNLAAAWGGIFGFDEPGLRSLSIVFAALTLVLTFFLARDLLDERAATAAAALLGLMPLWLMFAHNARYYSLSALLAVLCALSTVRFARRGHWLWLPVYVASTALYLYLIYTAIAVQLMCFLLGLFVLRTRPPAWSTAAAPLHPSVSGWRAALWIGAQGLVWLIFLPRLTGIWELVGRYPQAAALENPAWELVKRLFYTVYVYSLGETLSPLHPAAWLGAGILVFIMAAAVRAYRRTSGFWVAVIFALGILGFNLALSLNAAVSATWQALPARNLSLLPFLAICLGAGIAALRPPLTALTVAALLGIYAFAGFNYYTGRSHLRPIFAVPWRQIMEQIAEEGGSQAVILCSRGDDACTYYLERFGYPRRTAGHWPAVAGAAELWWIQTNLDRTERDPTDQKTLVEIQATYRTASIQPFALQDSAIQALKQKWLGQSTASERLTLYRFTDPIEEAP